MDLLYKYTGQWYIFVYIETKYVYSKAKIRLMFMNKAKIKQRQAIMQILFLS